MRTRGRIGLLALTVILVAGTARAADAGPAADAAPTPSPAQTPPATYPPPGHYPPPGYYYPPPQPGRYPRAHAAPPRSRGKRGFLALANLGLHSYQNEHAGRYGPGLRLGGLIGGRVGEVLSINADVTFDLSNRNDVPSRDIYREWTVGLALGPLVHLPAGPLELAVGPKLGIFVIDIDRTIGGVPTTVGATGFSAGVNAGAFVPVYGRTSIGMLLSFALLWIQRCRTISGTAEACDSFATTSAGKVIGVAAAALY